MEVLNQCYLELLKIDLEEDVECKTIFDLDEDKTVIHNMTIVGAWRRRNADILYTIIISIVDSVFILIQPKYKINDI